MKITLFKANKKHIQDVGLLFDMYRQFYKYESSLIKSTNYIKDRITNKESVILNLIFKKNKNNYVYYNCLKKKFENKEITNLLNYFSDYFSEIMLSDFLHDGIPNSFDTNILRQKTFKDKGTLFPNKDNTPNENAISVAEGIAQPFSVTGSL